MLRGEFVEGLADGQDLVVIGGSGQFNLLNIHMLLAASVAHGPFVAGPVNENAPHRFGRGGEEVGAVLEMSLAIRADEPQPGFVNERGGLQSLARGFAGHPVRGQSPQLIINQRQQLLRGLGIALPGGLKNARGFRHACRIASGQDATTRKSYGPISR